MTALSESGQSGRAVSERPQTTQSRLICLFRYRYLKSSWIGLVSVLVGVIGVLEAWHFLPQFKDLADYDGIWLVFN